MEDEFDKLTPEISSFLREDRVEAPTYEESKMWEYINNSQISLSCPINKPPAIMTIADSDKNVPIFTRGNFSLFKGQAKARKTFGLSMIASALAYDSTVYGKFIPDMQGQNVLFIDTEQSEYHVYRFVKSVSNVAGYKVQSPSFTALCLRPYSTEMRLKMVEFLIYNAKNLGYVIIDGIRDLIKDINSLDEAVMITDKLLKWTKEKNIHISCVLHENPSAEVGKARGHIGTELTNKAETIIRFEKNKENKNQSIISPSETRGEEFEPIYFEIAKTDNGLVPIIVNQTEFISGKIETRF